MKRTRPSVGCGLPEQLKPEPDLRHALPLAAAGTSYTPPELARIYNFPAGADGNGQSVAIVELGGGFGQADLDTYFGRERGRLDRSGTDRV